MTNKEIDERLRKLKDAIPNLADQRYSDLKLPPGGNCPISIELELLNMNAMAIWAMLSEIAKRLPEAKEDGVR